MMHGQKNIKLYDKLFAHATSEVYYYHKAEP